MNSDSWRHVHPLTVLVLPVLPPGQTGNEGLSPLRPRQSTRGPAHPLPGVDQRPDVHRPADGAVGLGLVDLPAVLDFLEGHALRLWHEGEGEERAEGDDAGEDEEEAALAAQEGAVDDGGRGEGLGERGEGLGGGHQADADRAQVGGEQLAHQQVGDAHVPGVLEIVTLFMQGSFRFFSNINSQAHRTWDPASSSQYKKWMLTVTNLMQC